MGWWGCDEDNDKKYTTTLDINAVPRAVEISQSNRLFFVEWLTFGIWEMDQNIRWLTKNYTWYVAGNRNIGESFLAKGLSLERLSGDDVLFSGGEYEQVGPVPGLRVFFGRLKPYRLFR